MHTPYRVDSTPEIIKETGTVPVRISVEYPSKLSRWLLFFKWLLNIPHTIALIFYSIAALMVSFAAFWAILFTGRYPLGLHQFMVDYMAFKYKTLSYFPLLLTDDWSTDEYHDLQFDAEYPSSASRRILVLVKLPALLLSIVSGFTGVAWICLMIVSVLAWFAILFTGRYPRKLFDINVALLQWESRITAWQWLLSDDWKLFGTTKPVQIAVGVGAAVLLLNSLSSTPAFDYPGADDLLSNAFGFVPAVEDGEAVIHQFMEASNRGDVDAAMAIVSPGATRAGVDSLLTQRPEYFADYLNLEVSGFDYTKNSGSPAALNISGLITYSAHRDREFAATLLRIDEVWVLDYMAFGE